MEETMYREKVGLLFLSRNVNLKTKEHSFKNTGISSLFQC